jgi:hypothetical protein
VKERKEKKKKKKKERKGTKLAAREKTRQTQRRIVNRARNANFATHTRRSQRKGKVAAKDYMQENSFPVQKNAVPHMRSNRVHTILVL